MGTSGGDKARLDVPEKRKHSGQVFVFGNGDVGQLGLGDEMLERKRPMPLKALEDEEIVDIVAGGIHTIAISKAGKVSCSEVFGGHYGMGELNRMYSFGVGVATTRERLVVTERRWNLVWWRISMVST